MLVLAIRLGVLNGVAFDPGKESLCHVLSSFFGCTDMAMIWPTFAQNEDWHRNADNGIKTKGFILTIQSGKMIQYPR